MAVVDAFGKKVGKLSEEDGSKARSLMLLGYKAQECRLKHVPDKRLPKSKQYLSWLIMHYMRQVLLHPEHSAMTSLFVPAEPLLASGFLPYSVEGFSAFMTGTRCQDALLDKESMDPCLCSYHRIFLGGVESGLLPLPPFLIYTNVACDANMITFPFLSNEHAIPRFFLEVPYEVSDESVHFVADRLKEMTSFIEDNAHVKVDEGKLRETVERSRKTISLFGEYLPLAGNHYVPGDITSQMYEIMTNHMLLGSEESLKYWDMTVKDYQEAPSSKGLKILWLHTIPFSQKPVRDLLNFNPRVRVVASEMPAEGMLPSSESDPYLFMANRLVHSAFNSSVDQRIARALEVASKVRPDGVVFYCHWGCKGTLASAPMVKEAMEKAGYPTLTLDGDGCDMKAQSDGQTETRLEAFVEMLEARK